MNKKERMERYIYTMGLNSWEISPYKGRTKRKIVLNDGPCGVRKPISQGFTSQDNILTSVCLPNPSALAASFDCDLVYKNGTYLAKDCLSKGVDILLAPGINIKRNVLCGRNFEYFSEDPFLNGVLGASYVKGLEDNGVGACIKHYCANNQEFFRRGGSSQLSLRALNEIYLEPFRYVCKTANPTAIMTSYNKVNDELPGESYYLLQTKLRNEFNYKGLIMSDWCAVEDKSKAIKNGLNLEMPISLRTSEYVEYLYQKGLFSESDLIKRDDEFYQAIKKFYRHEECIDYDFEAVHNEAINIAQETMVLVKNKHQYLPFNSGDKVLIIGYFAQNMRYVGGGSGWVNAYKKENFITILDEEKINYHFIPGFEREKVLLTKEELSKYHDYKVLLFLGQYDEDESEGRDRKTISLHQEQDEVLKIVSEVFKKFAVIVTTGSVINLKKVYTLASSVMISYLAGEGQSKALYNNIFGNHNPCGRLPETWISNLSQHPLYKSYLKYNPFYSYYDEDIFVGYRYYSQRKKGFMLPFGYGISYSKFSYSNFKIRKLSNHIKVTLSIYNLSSYDGNDIVQVYISMPKSSIYRPIRELKAFKKVYVKAHQSVSISILIPDDDLKVYHISTDRMEIENGEYIVEICSDSTNVIKSFSPIYVRGTIFEENKQIPKLNRKKVKAKFTFLTPVGCALKTPVFKEYLRNCGYNEQELQRLDDMQWTVLADLHYSFNKPTFFQLEELIDILNHTSKRKQIPLFLKDENVQDKF